jgi:chemosensory pili system protein ChpC
MSTAAADERIHSLEIPLAGASLLVPSAAVAEVTNPTEVHPLPGAPAWVLGVIGWRSQPVPVISFEALIGKPVPPLSDDAKIVVFYPLAGPRDGEFYAMLAIAEPRPQPITSKSIETEDPARLPDTPLIAAGVRIKGRTLYIPDFDALRRTFFP